MSCRLHSVVQQAVKTVPDEAVNLGSLSRIRWVNLFPAPARRSQTAWTNGRYRYDADMPGHLKIFDNDGSSSLIYGCDGVPADAAVLAAGHDPGGYFWEGVARYVAGGLVSQVVLDCEASMFCAVGDRALLVQLGEKLEVYLDDPEAIAGLIAEAAAKGFEFDD